MKQHLRINKIHNRDFRQAFVDYNNGVCQTPLLFDGDASSVLQQFPDNSIDTILTSPPYWKKREYDNGGIGLEDNYIEYIAALMNIFAELKRVLKPEGSFWLNLGDSYKGKRLVGVPWRIAFELIDNQGWILRNSIIWNKQKGGMDSSKDRLGNVHENVFHFVKQANGYYYDADAIRSQPRDSKVVKGVIVSATGVSGVRYRNQIELSAILSDAEKSAALTALDKMLCDIGSGRASDFRMIIRGQQRVTHSDREKVSGRARELRDKGFYFLKYNSKGSKPNDVWNITPEDTQSREVHFASYPIELCTIPLLATCPKDGIVLDPFSGTGTTLVAAQNLRRKSVGIDISRRYLKLSLARCEFP